MAVPPSDPTQIRQHSATQKVSGTSTNSSRHTQTGFPFPYAASRAELSRAIQYGNYRSTIEQLLATWKKKLGDDLRRAKCLTIRKAAAHEIPNLRVPPPATVVTRKDRVLSAIYLLRWPTEKRTGGAKSRHRSRRCFPVLVR